MRVFASGLGNRFMTDLAVGLVEACVEIGRTAELVTDRLPSPDEHAVNLVVAPHELFHLSAADDAEIRRAAACSVVIGTEQPGTTWFELGLRYARSALAAFDINRHGVEAAARAGVTTRWLQLGATTSMIADRRPTTDAGDESSADATSTGQATSAIGRDVDVVFLGGDTPRRQQLLAGLASVLAPWRCDLRLFPVDRPVSASTPGLVFGAEKFALLGRSRILVNIHRDDQLPAYFEWARLVEAMANGCAVVTESATGFSPLRAGEQFVDAGTGASALGDSLAALLRDPQRCSAIGEAGRRAVVDEYPLRRSVAELLDTADAGATRQPAAVRRLGGSGLSRPNRRSARASSTNDRRRTLRQRRTRPTSRQAPTLPPFRPFADQRARLYRAFLDEVALRRRLDAARCQLVWGQRSHTEVHQTPAAGTVGTVDVSVVVPLYDYAEYVIETLDSLLVAAAAPGAGSVELIVVDDHSTDDSRSVVTAFLDAHPDDVLTLLARDDNQGLARARNLGIEHARGEHVLLVDADNLVYPRAIAALRRALDDDPTAAFAYTMLEAFGDRPGLRSQWPWNPEWLCRGNYVDAQAMFRRSTFDRHGGYADDDLDVYGWEDWELWLRLAAAGEHGVAVPEMLGRYRTHAGSMVSITTMVDDLITHHLVSRYPDLPW